jgi:hypothetical protein
VTGFDVPNAIAAARSDRRLRQINKKAASKYGPEWGAQVDRNYKAQAVFGVAAQRREINRALAGPL